MAKHQKRFRKPDIAKLRGNCPMSNKVRYRDFKEAKQAMKAIKIAALAALELTGETTRHECRLYECPACHGIHATSAAA